MASLLTLAYVFARERMAPWWCVPVAALLALVVGFTRVWLDAHWLTDVAGGWSVGAALALGGIALYERLRVVDREHAAAARDDEEVEDVAAR
jgi:membrane-associated phospholipid phosphatase